MTFVSTAWEYNISLFQYWIFSDIFRSSTRISNYVKNSDPVFHFLGFLIATKKSGLTCCETRPYTENRRESQSLGKKQQQIYLSLHMCSWNKQVTKINLSVFWQKDNTQSSVSVTVFSLIVSEYDYIFSVDEVINEERLNDVPEAFMPRSRPCPSTTDLPSPTS